jgi:hypothetical protein
LKITLKDNIELLKLIIIACFGICGIIITFEVFVANNSIMHIMIKAMDTGVMSSDDVISKSYLLPIIPGVVVLERMWKKINAH